MTAHPEESFVSRAGVKLAAALDAFGLDVSALVCADLGSHVGGFVDCLLQRGAARVYAVETGYGVLAWKLRKDERVEVRERTNALHVELPEPVDLVTIDVGWTRQAKILPHAASLTRAGGQAVSLVKPHYEADPADLEGGVLPDDLARRVVDKVLAEVPSWGWTVAGVVQSPLRGHGGNTEYLAGLRRIENSE